MVLVIDWGSPNQQWCVDWLHYLHTIVVFFFCTQRVALSNHSNQLGWRMSTLVRVIHSMIIVKCLVIWFTTYLARGPRGIEGWGWKLIWPLFWKIGVVQFLVVKWQLGLGWAIGLLCSIELWFAISVVLFIWVQGKVIWVCRSHDALIYERVSWFNNSASKSTYV